MNLAARPTRGLVPSLVHDLLRPEAYPPYARTRRVQLVETHISWVFLLDDEVFKVKKPVDLGYLDFRTLEKRAAACDAEVHLNRRLAPDAYLGVVPVRVGDDGRLRMGGGGAVVDWAVHMVRLPHSHRADELLQRGKLTADIVDTIARRIAVFHSGCCSDAATRRFGSVDALERNLEENFAQTRDSIEAFVSAEQAEDLRRWQRAFLRGHAALFEKRWADGHVRDGHGDLRLEHVYVDGGEVAVLDCIEFNDRFRFADVCADIAFLAMDLAGHGRVDAAEQLLATYAREANDFDLYAVVELYESYRAFVRGKIASMLACDAAVDDTTRMRAGAEARRYYLLALSVDRRPLLLPAVVAVGGVIASGKSTVAEAIGRAMSAPVVDADRTRKAVLGVEATDHLDDAAWMGAYTRDTTDRVYGEVMRRAAVVLESGRPVVLDASFRSASMRAAARDLAITHNVPFRFVECRAPVDVCRSRLVDRQAARGVSDGRLEIFESFAASFERVNELAPNEHVVLDTTRLIAANLEKLRTDLDTWPAGFVT